MTSLKNLHANEIAENLAKLLGDDSFMQIHRKASLNVEASPQNLQQFMTGLGNTTKAEDAWALLRSYTDGKDKTTQQPYFTPQEAAQAETATRSHASKLKTSEIQTTPKQFADDDNEDQDAADGCQHAADATCQQCGDSEMMADDESAAQKWYAGLSGKEQSKVRREGEGMGGSTKEVLQKLYKKHMGTKAADDPAFSVAVDFAINHLVKVADALDGNGFAVVANMVDETIQKLAKKKSDKDDKKESKKSEKDEDDKKESKKESKKSEKDDKEKK